MKNRNWKIVYSNFEGPEKRAIELLVREIGGRILRDPGIYSIHALACEKVGCALDKNCFVVGTYDGNPLLQRLLSRAEVPQGGYAVKIVDNPDDPSSQLVLIAGDSPTAVLWAAVDFVDDGLAEIAPKFDGHTFDTDIFELPRLAPYSVSKAPKSKTRSVFFWGHTVDDYQTHFANLARLKFNEVIIWNEYPPVNAKDVVECAHSYGIGVVWGFSWGWGTDCRTSADLLALDRLQDSIIEQWRSVWKPLGGDGIYFQSFTELSSDNIGGIQIADTVVGLVNATCARILEEDPGLKIEFGLHATSVRTHMDVIAKVDKRIEIIWEDCGGFPYKTTTPMDPEGDMAFTEEMLGQKRPMGLVFKCQAMLDWSRNRFNHQPGPYLFGVAGPAVLAQDLEMLDQIWHRYTHDWLMNGKVAYDLTKRIHAQTEPLVTLNTVGNLSGPIRFPTALISELFWNTDEPYDTILSRVLKRRYCR